MVYAFAEQSKSRPSRNQLIAAVRRNFGGLDTIDPLQIIKDMFPTSLSPDNVGFIIVFLKDLEYKNNN